MHTATARPRSRSAPWARQEAEELLAGLFGDDVEPTVRARLVREAEGNPLYLEELAQAFQEGALEAHGHTWTISMRSPELLPPTLENLLLARIDRLAAGPRRLAQTAAAIGRTFPVGVLTLVMEEDVADDLAALFRTEVVRELRRYPDFECEFTHGLLQEVALSTLTAAARRDLYGHVAAAFEEIYAGSLDEHLERLAHYHAQSGNLPRALEYAERARERLSLALEPPVLRVPEWVERRRDHIPERLAVRDHERNLVERDDGHVVREPPVCPLEDAGLRIRVEDPLSLVEIARHQALAVARVVLVAAAAEEPPFHLADRFRTRRRWRRRSRRSGRISPKREGPESVGRNDLDSRPPELPLDELDGSLSKGGAGGRIDAQ